MMHQMETCLDELAVTLGEVSKRVFDEKAVELYPSGQGALGTT